MSVVQEEFGMKENDTAMDANNFLETIFMILNSILDYTKDLEEKTPSIFDHYHHSQDSDKSSLSTSYSDSSSGGSDFYCELDKYDIEDFIVLCYKKMGFSLNLLVLSMMYLDKLLANNFILTYTNVHKVFFICMMETQKYYDDINFKNKDYAKLCGITIDELLELELEFMNYMNFNLNIKDEDFLNYKKKLKKLYQSNIMISNKYIENQEVDEDDN